MSYDVYFNRQFIRVTDTKCVMMFQTGSSSMRNENGGISRSWDSHRIDGGLLVSKENILHYFEDILKDRLHSDIGYLSTDKVLSESEKLEAIKKGFSSWGGTVYAGKKHLPYSQVVGYYTNGIKHALTVEELRELGVNICVLVSTYDEKEIKSKGLPILERKYPKTSEELLAILTAHQLLYGCHNYTCVDWVGEWAVEALIKKRRQRKNTSNVQREYITQDHYFALTVTHTCHYLHRILKNGYSYNNSPGPAKKFSAEGEAQRFVEKYKDRLSLTVVRINQSHSFLKRRTPKKSNSISNQMQLI